MSGQLIPPPDLAPAPLPDHLTVGQRIALWVDLMNACDAMLRQLAAASRSRRRHRSALSPVVRADYAGTRPDDGASRPRAHLEATTHSFVITSPHNQRVKEAARLRDARARRKQDRIVIDGARELLRAIEAGIELAEVFVCEELCQSDGCHNFLQLIAEKQHPVEQLQVSRPVFEKLAYGHRTEGLIGIAKTPSRSLAELTLPPNPLVAVLEGVEKPGNVGAVLRSADAAGVSALIVTDGATDLYNPNAIRASLGAIFTVPFCAASATETIEWVMRRGLMVYTTRVDANTDYATADFTRPCAIVLGSESEGLSDRWSPPSDQASDKLVPIRLPMRGHVDSLNVSAAAAVLFYEALRQRESHTGAVRR